ncbi:glycoside hydrolase family 88 protein, partial [Melanomma pulvis-pyrius CBS 109.77]
LFAENVIAKVLRTATNALSGLPDTFPEYVPQNDGHDGSYTLREADFWTCGFFPGTLYSILERFIRFPQSLRLLESSSSATKISVTLLQNQLSALSRSWTEPLHGMAGRTDTHDIGFIVMPALRLDWELTSNTRSLNSIIRAAKSLATRYVPSAKAIRSWDLLKKKDIEILDQEDNMIVIIDSLCNLDLLYYASKYAHDGSDLADMATAHAETLLESHLRPELTLSISRDGYKGQWYSTCHVANLDPKTGRTKRRLTAQGYANGSTWARGQAWGILGYAQTYSWTKDKRFLYAACGLAEYFLYRLEVSPVTEGRYVPLWDFDAPIENVENALRDSSAGTIAANGMLILSQILAGLNQDRLASRFRKAALRIIQDTLSFALAPEKARLINGAYEHVRTEDSVSGSKFEGILKFGTANNNINARKRYANHGLVYGDYYLVEFGNRLLRMGI